MFQLQEDLGAERSKGAAAKADHDQAIIRMGAQCRSLVAGLKAQHAGEARDWDAALARRDRESEAALQRHKEEADQKVQRETAQLQRDLEAERNQARWLPTQTMAQQWPS